MKYGRLTFLVLTLLWSMQSTVADFSFKAPRDRTQVSVSRGTARVRIEWSDDGDAPTLDDIEHVKVLLCGGPNDALQCLDEAVAELDKSAVRRGSYEVAIRQGAVRDGTYLFQLFSNVKGGTTIQYTQRFLLRGMSGTRAMPDSQDRGPPARIVSVQGWEPWMVPYASQTGRLRHAPMQLQPGTKVTARTWSRRYPTSGVTYFATPVPTLLQDTTITMGWSYTMSSAVNHAPPAPFPSAIGWYDPAERLTNRPRKLNVIKTTASASATAT
ncbi:AaceriAFR590Wp [[Ashbya] aceris (nom. inval.)]|nr:AaceriAFR590Wp [[Ashbya] aceris (nom. inval.)]